MSSKCKCLPETKSGIDLSKPIKICVVGSGNWGTTIARIIGENVKRHPHLHDTVNMYVHEEMIDGRKLTEIINEEHENVKYLPGYRIPTNIVAIPDIVDAVKDADALIFVLPHQFIVRTCEQLVGKIKLTAQALSLIKGFYSPVGKEFELVSNVIGNILSMDVSVLMGANLANEIAAGNFAESTLGCRNKEFGPLWIDILQNDLFRVTITEDKISLEVYSALKNVVALGAGFIEGLEWGLSSKSAMMRLGMLEMIQFIDVLYPGCKITTFFESCGIADLITSCFGGRNHNMATLFVKDKMDGNVPCRRPTIVRVCFEEHSEQFIEYFGHRLSDMNHVDHIWDVIDRSSSVLQSPAHATTTQLWAAIDTA